jgi:hypothetical protein
MLKKILVHAALALAYFTLAIILVLVSIALFEQTLPNVFFGWALFLPVVVVLMGAHQQPGALKFGWGLAFALVAALLWTAFLAALFGERSLAAWSDTFQSLLVPVFLPTAVILFALNAAISVGSRLLARSRLLLDWPVINAWLPAASLSTGLGALLLILFGILTP